MLPKVQGFCSISASDDSRPFFVFVFRRRFPGCLIFALIPLYKRSLKSRYRANDRTTRNFIEPQTIRFTSKASKKAALWKQRRKINEQEKKEKRRNRYSSFIVNPLAIESLAAQQTDKAFNARDNSAR